MRKCPNSIYILAALHFLAPIFTVVLSRLLKNESLTLSTLFTPASIAANWPNYALPIVGGICIYLCKKWSLVAYLVTMAALFIFSYSNFASEVGNGSTVLLALCWAINTSVVVYFLKPNLRRVYTDPNLRWWERSKRYNSDFTASFTIDEDSTTCEVLNISKTGLLLRTDSALTENKNIELIVKLNDQQSLELSGQIIEHKQFEFGYGVKFDPKPSNKKSAKKIISNLKTL